MDIYRKFIEALGAYRLRSGVIVAFSGGADSTCLLTLFLTAAARGDFPYPLAAAHLNHCLRGEESHRDAQFCEAFCKAHDIPLFCEAVDVAALAEEKRCGIEEAARDARYTFFDRLLTAESAYAYVATAHNQNDLCETMLFNLARGTGPDGLCSIPARRESIIRPLLQISREEILRYHAAHAAAFVTDSTNASTAYSRNRIRQEVLPALAAILPQATDSMARTARLLRTDADFLQAEAAKQFDTVVCGGALDTEKAQNIHKALLSRILRMLYNHTCGAVPDCAHIEAITTQIEAGRKCFRLSMPRADAVCTRGLLRFVPHGAASPPFSLPMQIDVPVTLPFGDRLLLTRETAPRGFPATPAATFAAEAFAAGVITVRSRREGDTIVFFGKTHKVKRVLADAKCSEEEKARLFFLASGDTLLYIRARAIADAAFYRGGDALRLYIQTKESKGDADGV